MKLWATCLLSCIALPSNAFPTLAASDLGISPERLKSAIDSIESYPKEKRFLVDSSRPIDISGKHAFKAPGKNDQRGPCPGLNALANHNYIAHDGVTSYGELVTAINQGSYCAGLE